MSLTVSTNVASLIAQQNLTSSESSLQTAMQRLSSGLRVNSAADDAAGYAIANGMTSQINAFEQAQQNANDGISLLQTASGALQQIDNNLQTIRQLTVEALNGTNSQADDSYIQTEINQDLAEINRVSSQGQLNGINLLGQNQTVNVQVGAEDNQVIPIGLQQIDTDTLGLTGFRLQPTSVTTSGATPQATLADVVAAQAPGDVIVLREAVDYIVNADNLYVPNSAVPAALNATAPSSPVTAAVVESEITQASQSSYAGHDIDVRPTNSSGVVGVVLANGDLQYAAQASNPQAGETVYFDAAGGPNHQFTTDATGGYPVATLADVFAVGINEASIQAESAYTKQADGTYVMSPVPLPPNLADANYTDPVSSESGLTAQQVAAQITAPPGPLFARSLTVTGPSGTTTYASQGNGPVTTSSGQTVYYDASASTLAGTLTTTPGTGSVTTTDPATPNPLATLDAAISKVSNLAVTLGAQQNRLTSALSDIQTSAVNLQAARSQIQDTDYAKEVSALTQAQILQQAGASVLSQANQTPQAVLTLLRNA
ncbi:MAG TPA: flagellin [Nevskiaceae bacterium]|nr:flagellin [Nevskiaceae bacterium]